MLGSSMSEARTQEPTRRRLERARREGRVPVSRELTGMVTWLAVLVTALWGSHVLVQRLLQCFALSIRAIRSEGAPGALLESCAALTVGPLLVLAVIVVGSSIVVGALQVGPLLSVRALTSYGRAGGAAWRAWASQRGAMRTLRLMLQLLWLASVAGWSLWTRAASLTRLAFQPPSTVLHVTGSLALEIGLRGAAGLAVLAVLDVLYQRYRHRVELRMSRSELRREQREEEGDPRSRARRKRLHGELVGSRSAGSSQARRQGGP